MKPKNVTIVLLVAGILLTTTFPMLSRRADLPDFLTGFATGIGIVLEIYAMVKLIVQRKTLTEASGS